MSEFPSRFGNKDFFKTCLWTCNEKCRFVLVPNQVGNLNVSASSASALNISWKEPPNGGYDEYTVLVTHSNSKSMSEDLIPVPVFRNTTSYTWKGLDAGVNHTVRVHALFNGKKSDVAELLNVPTSK